MGRIKNTVRYTYDVAVSGDDYLIGTDAENSLRTRSYKISDLTSVFSPEFVPRTALSVGPNVDPTYFDSSLAYTRYGRVTTVFLGISISAAPITGSGILDAVLPVGFRPYQQVRVSIGNDVYGGPTDGFIFVSVDSFGNISIQNNGLYTGNFIGILTYVAEENDAS